MKSSLTRSLPSPSPPTLTNSLPLVDTDITERKRSSNPLHSYLDDFLSAIRIFGYLEKPIFHELSRHLQTRRLAAGDTIEVGGGDFWCVVEGNVQVVSGQSVLCSHFSLLRRQTQNPQPRTH